MIELFDPARLVTRRDQSLALTGMAMAAGALVLAVYAGHLQRELSRTQAAKVDLEGRLRQIPSRPAPSPALLADLQRELQASQAELAMAGIGAQGEAPTPPSAWLDRLAALGSAEVSLSKIEVDAQGGTRIEGMATNPQAVSGFVQAFARHEALAGLKPRGVEVRQDKSQAPHLRFQLRASAPPLVAAAPAAGPSPAAALPPVATAPGAPGATAPGAPVATAPAAAVVVAAKGAP